MTVVCPEYDTRCKELWKNYVDGWARRSPMEQNDSAADLVDYVRYKSHLWKAVRPARDYDEDDDDEDDDDEDDDTPLDSIRLWLRH